MAQSPAWLGGDPELWVPRNELKESRPAGRGGGSTSWCPYRKLRRWAQQPIRHSEAAKACSAPGPTHPACAESDAKHWRSCHPNAGVHLRRHLRNWVKREGPQSSPKNSNARIFRNSSICRGVPHAPGVAGVPSSRLGLATLGSTPSSGAGSSVQAAKARDSLERLRPSPGGARCRKGEGARLRGRTGPPRDRRGLAPRGRGPPAPTARRRNPGSGGSGSGRRLAARGGGGRAGRVRG